ncbi:MAG: TetR/AcrR family transcriptional regulator, partial [Olegusella sp.]|nr:TetR/AcrR family transcriptional regulator [Olegusella sp.]
MAQPAIEQKGTQRRIRDAVFACMAHTDMDKIRVSDVIRIAHVSRSTFYRYYDDVPSVVLQFEDDLLANMRAINNVALKARFSTNQLDATPTMITRMEMLADHRDEIVALNGPHGDPT